MNLKSILYFSIFLFAPISSWAGAAQPSLVCMFDTSSFRQERGNNNELLQNAARLLFFRDATGSMVPESSFDVTLPDGTDAGEVIQAPFKAVYAGSFSADSAPVCCTNSECHWTLLCSIAPEPFRAAAPRAGGRPEFLTRQVMCAILTKMAPRFVLKPRGLGGSIRPQPRSESGSPG